MTVGELQLRHCNGVGLHVEGGGGGQFDGDPTVVKLVERYRSRMLSDRVYVYQPTPTESKHAECGDENTDEGGSHSC